MSLESALAFFIAILIFSVTPGPGVFAILARAMLRGTQACFSLALGMAVSDIVYLLLACYGLAAIAESWGGLFTVIRLVGAIYLLYLGWKMWHAHLETEQEGSGSGADSPLQGFVQGFLISASNPKVILFYIAFLPSFMDLTVLSANDVVLAAAIALVGLMLGLMLIAVSAAWARRYFRSEGAMKGLNRMAGSIMMAAGVYIGVRS